MGNLFDKPKSESKSNPQHKDKFITTNKQPTPTPNT